MDFWIWRDAIDKDTYILGVKQQSGKFMAWATMYIDAISDMLGHGFSEQLYRLDDGKPHHVTGSIAIE